MFNYLVKGKGTLALATYGGLHTLDLGPEQVFYVDPRHVIAWESHLNPEPVQVSSQPAPESSTNDKNQHMPATWQDRATELSKKSLQWTAQTTASLAQASVTSVKRSVFGINDFYKVVGPGSMVISSIQEPKLEWIKSPQRSVSSHSKLIKDSDTSPSKEPLKE